MDAVSETKENKECKDDEILFVSEKKLTNRLLTLTEKIEMIEHYKMHKNIRLLSRKYQCGISQIRRILRDKEKFLDDWKYRADVDRMKRGIADDEWLRRCQCYPIKLTNQSICNKALDVKKHLRMAANFLTNKEWLKRFKKKCALNKKELLNNKTNYKKHEPRKSLSIEDIMNDETFKDHVLEISKKESNGKKVSNGINLDESKVDEIDVATITKDLSSKENLSAVLNVSGETIKDYKKAVSVLQLLGEFALFKENVRAVGLINQLEVFYRDEIVGNSSKDGEVCLLTVEQSKSSDIRNFREAKLYLWPLHQFSLERGNVNAVALIKILNNIFIKESLKADIL